MIASNELRAGNWIHENISKQNVQVQWAQPCEVVVKMVACDYVHGDLEDFDPIELSEDILVKSGFKKDGFGSYAIELHKTYQTGRSILYFAGDYLYLRCKNNGNPTDDDIFTLWNKDLMRKFYLHKLQNIFYDFTGIELEVNL